MAERAAADASVVVRATAAQTLARFCWEARAEDVRADDAEFWAGFDDGNDVLPARGGDSFAEARAREARRTDNRARRREEKKLEMEEKLERHKEEEEAKLDQFRALLAQGPIKIRKRSEL